MRKRRIELRMTVSAGSKTVGGSYATGDFDIADLEAYGVGGLIHALRNVAALASLATGHATSARAPVGVAVSAC